jgi:hypothetical protein
VTRLWVVGLEVLLTLISGSWPLGQFKKEQATLHEPSPPAIGHESVDAVIIASGQGWEVKISKVAMAGRNASP